MVRKTVAIDGLGVFTAAPLFMEKSQRPSTQAAGFATGPLSAKAFPAIVSGTELLVRQPTPAPNCNPHYPDVCVPLPPPDLGRGEMPFCRFRVAGCDPHRFGGDGDGSCWQGAAAWDRKSRDIR